MEFLIFVAVVVVIAAGSRAVHAQRLRRWRDFADSKGLVASGMGILERPRIHGLYQGVQVVVQNEVHGSGKNRRTYTRFTAHFHRVLPGGMHVTAEGLGDKIVKFFGGQDIQLGQDGVDRALRIKGADPGQVREVLGDRALRAAVATFIAQYPRTGTVTASESVVLESGFQTRPERLESRLRAVTRVAQAANGALGVGADAGDVSAGRALAVPGAPASFQPADATHPAAAAPPAAVAEPLPAALASLGDPLLPSSERAAEVAAWKGRRFCVGVHVAGVSMTTDADVPAAYRDGRTVTGRTSAGLHVAVCAPKSMDLRALSPGNEALLQGEVHKWDALYGRLVLLA